jgi:hypothetical protein
MEEVVVREVSSDREEDAFMLAFALEQNDDQALVFSLGASFDQQDAMLGMDTYSITTGSGATTYGGLVSARLDGSLLMLQFKDEPAATLGLPLELALRLPDSASVAKVRDGLGRLGIGVRDI